MIYKTLQKQLKIEEHEPNKEPVLNLDAILHFSMGVLLYFLCLIRSMTHSKVGSGWIIELDRWI